MSHSSKTNKPPQSESSTRDQSRGGVALTPPPYGVEMVDAVVQREHAGTGVDDSAKVR